MPSGWRASSSHRSSTRSSFSANERSRSAGAGAELIVGGCGRPSWSQSPHPRSRAARPAFGVPPRCLRCASNAGAVGPKLVYWDDPRMIQSVGIAVDRFGNSLPIADDGELDQEQHDAVQDVFIVSSACIMVRADLFATINGFNPDLPGASADLDLCWRLHATAARVMVVPSAIGRHRENSSPSTDLPPRDKIFNKSHASFGPAYKVITYS